MKSIQLSVNFTVLAQPHNVQEIWNALSSYRGGWCCSRGHFRTHQHGEERRQESAGVPGTGERI